MNSPIPHHYDTQNAAALVCLSARAYGVEHETQMPVGLNEALSALRGAKEGVRREIVEAQPRRYIEDAGTETRAVVFQDDEDLVVAFRGTMDLRNWWTDLDVATVAQDGCKIHAGFWRALDSVFAQVCQAVQEEGAGRRLWLTGHSLGGALALLFGWRLMNLRRANAVAGIYTFGQPRVGDAAFRESWPFQMGLAGGLFRVVHAVDIVPHLPWLCGLYRHCGHEVFYPSQISNLRFEIDQPAWLYALRDVLALVSETLRPTSFEEWLADHHVGNYVNLFNSRWGETPSNPNISQSIVGSTEGPTGNAL